MSTDGIDAKKLKEAIEFVRRRVIEGISPISVGSENYRAVLAAAEAHLATLPREVEVVLWVVINDEGHRIGYFDNEADARKWSECHVVRLTGTAALPKG